MPAVDAALVVGLVEAAAVPVAHLQLSFPVADDTELAGSEMVVAAVAADAPEAACPYPWCWQLVS